MQKRIDSHNNSIQAQVEDAVAVEYSLGYSFEALRHRLWHRAQNLSAPVLPTCFSHLYGVTLHHMQYEPTPRIGKMDSFSARYSLHSGLASRGK